MVVKRESIQEMVSVLAHAELYIGSSMHGSIISHSYGVPAVTYVGGLSRKVAYLYGYIPNSLMFDTVADICHAANKVAEFYAISRGACTEAGAMYAEKIMAFLHRAILGENGENIRFGSATYNDSIGSLYLSQQATYSNIIFQLEGQVKAERRNGYEQITYRDRLLNELRSELEKQRKETAEQISHRDCLIAELQARLEQSMKSLRMSEEAVAKSSGLGVIKRLFRLRQHWNE